MNDDAVAKLPTFFLCKGAILMSIYTNGPIITYVMDGMSQLAIQQLSHKLAIATLSYSYGIGMHL